MRDRFSSRLRLRLPIAFLTLLLVGSLLLGAAALPGCFSIMIPFCVLAVVVLFTALAVRPGFEYLLFLTAVCLCGLGLLMAFRLDAGRASLQAVWAVMGMLLFLLVLVLVRDASSLSRYKYVWAAAGLVLLGSSLVFGVQRGGAKLWLPIGPYSFQPSEVAKVLLALFFAAYLAGVGRALGSSGAGAGLTAYRAVLGPLLVVWGGVLLLFVLERDLGTPIILFGAFLAVWYAATAKRGVALLSAVALGAGLYWASHLFPHVMNRFLGWADPWGRFSSSGFQVAMSLFSVADGGILGRGLGMGQPNLVPAVSTDFIFDAFAEELGLVGGGAIILLSAFLAFLCFRTALRTADGFGRLLAVGLGAELSIQALTILGGNLRALPVTGVTLPFVSRGGSSAVSGFLALALVSAVSRLPSRRIPAPPRQRGKHGDGQSLAVWEQQQIPLDNALVAVCRGVLLCFLGLAFLQLYWGVFAAPRLAMNPSNPRAQARTIWAEKGRILDRSGNVLVESRWTPDGYMRAYPQGGSEFVDVVGYDSPTYGQTGIEKAYFSQLLGAPRHVLVGWNGVEVNFSPTDVQLTLDVNLQRLASRLLKGRRGAAILLDPATGKILALASSPSFSPSALQEEWQSLVNDPGKPFINRATAGLYPPGSAFKVFTLSAALASGVVSEADTFTCKGKERVGGTLVTCHNTKGHGRIPLRVAFTQSCNIAFAKIGLRLGWDRFQEMARRFLLDSRFDLPVQTSEPRIPQGDEMTPAMLAECSFGQGALLVTPLHLTLIAAAIANRGVIVQPRLVQQVVENDKISPTEPEIASRAIDAKTAEKVKELMVGVVEAGTGTPARIAGIKVAGKTGTAENPSGEPHSWFVGFAPADSPRVAVGVIVENAGWGATVAAPIARQLLVAALRR